MHLGESISRCAFTVRQHSPPDPVIILIGARSVVIEQIYYNANMYRTCIKSDKLQYLLIHTLSHRTGTEANNKNETSKVRACLDTDGRLL